MIKLIATDIDGTLLDHKRRLSFANRRALEEARSQGIKVVLCSGRPYLAMKDLIIDIDLLGPEDYSVAFNGGQILHNQSQTRVYQELLNYEDFSLWRQLAQEYGLDINPVDGQWVYQALDGPTSYYVNKVTTAPFMEMDFAKFDSETAFIKFVLTKGEDNITDLSERMKARLEVQGLVQHYQVIRSHDFQLEIMPANVSKANALAILCQRLAIQPSEVMTLGDQENDRSMIQWSGIGVAMGNAIPTLKEEADYVTLHHNDSGVAQAIRKFVL